MLINHITLSFGDSNGTLKDYQYDIATSEDTGKIFGDNELAESFRKANIIVPNTDGEGGELFVWPTNLMGKARVELQLEPTENMSEDDILVRKFGYTIIFLGLVIYTILFLFRYLKRLLMLAFLTIIAPFVAMTYPLDKMNDGNAQAFNMWIKEYIYNLLIQPIHLILYTILIGSAIDFAADNLIYALAALGFILQAEKIMRKFFGFEKASTLAGGSALGGALAMQGINMLRRVNGGKGKKSGGKNGGESSSGDNSKINYKRSPDKGKSTEELLNGMTEEGGKNNPSNEPPDKRSADAIKLEGSREAGRELLEEANTDEERRMIQNMMEEDRESDTRGIGQAIYDRYQEGGFHDLKSKMHTIGTPIRYTRNLAGAGIKKARDLGGRAVRKIPKPLRNTIRGATSTIGAGVKYVAPKAARLAVKGTVAGAAAMGGIAAGLVSDDYSNVAKWGAAGAGAGWIAGGGISSATGKLSEIDDKLTSAAETGDSIYTLNAHGPEAEKQRQKDIADRKAMQDKERRKLYENKLKLSAAQAKEAMQDAQKYRESGITDDELIIKTMKSQQFGTERASKEKIILAGLAGEVGKEEKKLKYVQQQLKDKGISKEDIDKYTAGIKDVNEWTI